MLKKVKIGVIRYTPRKTLEGTGTSVDGVFIPAQHVPAFYTWEESESIPYREGLLHNFFMETDGDAETTVVGLVEHEDGTLDTYAAGRLKFEIPTTQHNVEGK